MGPKSRTHPIVRSSQRGATRLRAARGARRLAALLLIVVVTIPAVADLADVFLKDGRILRGDVTVTESEVTLSNAVGTLRFARQNVLRVEPVEPPPAAPTSQPAEVAQPPDQPPPARGVPAPPLLSNRDIQRLKLYEFPMADPPERQRIKFLRKSGVPTLDNVVLGELAKNRDVEDGVLARYRRSTVGEKVQLILEYTGMKHADRIEIRGDTEVFTTFRRKVMPVVLKGCARSGCHGSGRAAVFRFPNGSRQTEAFAYTSFLLLDRMNTEFGPLIDRENPDNSVLTSFLLPQEENDRPHPEVGKGRRFLPELRSVRDRKNQEIVNWIASLHVPHPDYDLHYKFRPGLGRAPADQTPTTRPSTLGVRDPNP